MRRREILSLPLLGAAFLAGGGAAAAAETPLSLIVPDLPGGEAGILARALQPQLEQALKQETLIDYRPGAGGILGLTAGARAPADGTTLTLLGPAITEAPWLTWRVDCTPDDFACLGRLTCCPTVLCVRPDSPFNRLAELISALQARPGELAAPAPAGWSTSELAQAMFLSRVRASVRRVAGLENGAQRLAALRDGQIDFAFALAEELRSGNTQADHRALAVSSAGRVPMLPDVPSFPELGLDIALGTWRALAVPAGTPRPVVERLASVLRSAMTSPQLAAEFAHLRINGAWLGPAETQQAVLTEYRAVGTLFASLGVNVRKQV